ncbi:PKD domain-containing protein [Micrococcus antarcticus]
MKLKLSMRVSLVLTFSVGLPALLGIQAPLGLADQDERGIRMRPESIHESHDEKKDFNYQEESRNSQPKKQPHSKPSPKEQFSIRDYESCDPRSSKARFCISIPEEGNCPDGAAPVYRQVIDSQGYVVRQYRYCAGNPPKIDLPEDSITQEILIDINTFKEYPILPSKIMSYPKKFSLRNGNTHFLATEEVQSFSSNLSGSNISIRAIPIQWNWNYGDGTTRNLDFPGDPMPHHTLRDKTPTSHSYRETGTFKVGVTTLYRGEFSVDGGAWQAIPGQAAVASVPIEIDVWRTEKELIAND